jgi:hypothetical protein
VSTNQAVAMVGACGVIGVPDSMDNLNAHRKGRADATNVMKCETAESAECARSDGERSMASRVAHGNRSSAAIYSRTHGPTTTNSAGIGRAEGIAPLPRPRKNGQLLRRPQNCYADLRRAIRVPIRDQMPL